MSSRGMELSVNFLVVLILSLVVFGIGITIARQVMKGAEDVSARSFADLDRSIEQLACAGAERVCLGSREKTIERKKVAIFGITIENVLPDAKTFTITTEVKGPVQQNVPLSSLPSENKIKLIPSQMRVESLAPKQRKTFGIGFRAEPDAPSGNYVADVNVQYGTPPQDYANPMKVYLHVE